MMQLRVPPSRIGSLLLVAALVVAGGRLSAVPAAPTLNPAVVLGPNVTFTWAGVAGATSYRIAASVTPGGPSVFSQNVGNVTTFGAAAGQVGTYYVKLYAIDGTGEGPASNEITVQIVSLFVPPTAPANLVAFVNGTSALLTWDLGAGGGAPTRLLLHAGTTPGSSNVGIFPLSVATQMVANNVAASTYYLRLVAENQGGQSPASNEATLVMPAGGGCSAPPARTFSTTIFGTYVRFSWPTLPGGSGFRIDFSQVAGGPVTLSRSFGPTTTGFSVPNAPLGTYFGKLTTAFACGSQATGAEQALTIDGAPPPGPRAPNPAPGTRIPVSSIAWGEGVVIQVANERPDLLAQSCRETGGNNRFLFEVLRRLRARDNRFGLNWKRGNEGDMSQDIIDYNPTDQSDEGNRNPYIIDIIVSHCGPRPGPAWIDQTEVTRERGAIGIWTLLPYLDAGYPIASDTPQQ